MLLSTLVAIAAAPSVIQDAKLLRFPDIHGDKVAFVYAGDIWTADLNGGFARRLTSSPGSEVSPRFSPDGTMIAFSGQYDSAVQQVYVMPADGGTPKRLTFESESAIVANWTPDGKIVYASAYGNPFTTRMWMVDPDGGMPIRTDLVEFTNGSFSPDGKQLVYNRNNSYVFTWRLYRGGTQGRLCFWDFEKETYTEAPAGREQNYWPMWIGDRVYFLSDRAQNNLNLWSYEPRTKRFEQLTRFDDGDIKNPQFDSKRIVFERIGALAMYDVAAKKVEPVSVTIAYDEVAARPRFRRFGESVNDFGLSPSGKRLVLTGRGDLYSVPAKNGPTRAFTSTPRWRERAGSWSPDGQTIAYLSDQSGEWRVWTQPQMGGEAKELGLPADHKVSRFNWSPDGKTVAYVTYDDKLHLFDLESSSSTFVVENASGSVQFDWAPNSDWVAYTKVEPNLFSAVYLYDVKAKAHHKVTEGYYNDGPVAFDMNGKFLYFVSGRTYGVNFSPFEIGLHQQNVQRVYAMALAKDTTDPFAIASDEEPVKAKEEPKKEEPKKEEPKKDEAKPADPKPAEEKRTKVDLDGLADRVIALPWPPASYGFLAGADNGVFTFSGGSLVRFDMASRQSQTILPGVAALAFSAKRDKIAYLAGGVLGIADVRPGIDPAAGRVPVTDVATVWQPRDEWTQMYWEAWRYMRDQFYDPEMMGLDWKAIGDKYAALLPYVSNRADLSYLFGLLIGELGTGHAYVQGGETNFQVPNAPVGKLGADYEVVGRNVRIKKVYKGLNFESDRRGPLGGLGVSVNDGDYLLEIDGKPVTGDRNLHEHLLDRVDKPVVLTVNSTTSLEGARKVTVRPIGDESELRYISWVEANRRYVLEKSGGRIGYMHVPNTSVQGIIEFVKGYYSQAGTDAMIVDERYNGGGFIPTFFVEALMRESLTVFRPRHGRDVPLPGSHPEGPKVMLINEFAGSGGDMLPWLFKRNGLGPLIGTRTWGGLVGITGGAPLVDGGSVTAPAFGIYDRETGKWIAENTGVDPDIEVDARPDLIAQGKDPVLDKGIEVLLNELKKNPPKKRPTPAFPRFGR